jgi:hypothetical protein
MVDANQRTYVRARSFYGVYRVVDDSALGVRQLYSGTTIHGSELFNDPGQVPLTYYHRDGPIGSLFAVLRAREQPLRIAAIGLGAGSMAAYARARDSWTFYEIDPVVAAIAADTTKFRFIAAAAEKPSIILGDARLSLKGAAPRTFDLIVVDAFSSDAIPVHLLTREALALYRSHLGDRGAIAWHISNKYVDLLPVVAGLAKDASLGAFMDADLTVAGGVGARSPSTWVVTTSDTAMSDGLTASGRWHPVALAPYSVVWTDDFSGVASLLRSPGGPFARVRR